MTSLLSSKLPRQNLMVEDVPMEEAKLSSFCNTILSVDQFWKGGKKWKHIRDLKLNKY